MDALPSLISDLAIILMLAGFITLLFKRIGQPVILGYILAGIIAGPSLDFFHITDTANIKTWADIGVIFLLFSIGLDFSFKKLFKMGSTVFITAFTIIVGMMTVGFFTGILLGWDRISSMFLGGMIAMSSTTIIIKTFEDIGIMKQQFAGLVIGVLIVEDLFAVVLMVLLSTLAISSSIEGTQLVFDIIRLFAFLLIWFVSGIYILPTFFEKMKKWLSDETLVVLAVALCLTMVLLATSTGFSSALGAFVMGSLLGETMEQQRMEKLVKPLKDLFGAVFFVSVGMMINPMGLLHNWLPILLISLTVVAGQMTFGTLGMLFSGQTLKVAMQSGFSLVQVGEFAFIIAQLGENLKVTNSDLYPTIVTVSAITTFITPFFVKKAGWAYERFTLKCPPRLLAFINRLSFSPKVSSRKFDNALTDLLKSIVSLLLFYLTIIVFIILIGFRYIQPLLASLISHDFAVRFLTAVIILGAISPFLRAVIIKKNKTIKHLWKENDVNKGILIGIWVFKLFLSLSIIGFVLSSLFHMGWVLLIAIALLTITAITLNKTLKQRSIAMERHFKANLNAKETIGKLKDKSLIQNQVASSLLERNLHLAEFEISSNSPNIGRKLKEIEMRQRYGVNIVSIIRGNQRINIPGGNELLYPADKIIVVGTDEQLQRFDEVMRRRQEQDALAPTNEDVCLEQFTLSEQSPFVGVTIRNSYLRDRYNCMIVGIERGAISLDNPDINEALQANDTLWVVGEKDKIAELAKDNE